MVVKIIGLGNLSIYHIHPLLSSAFYLLRSFAFMELILHYSHNWNDNDPIFLTLIMFLGESVVCVFILIERCINRKASGNRNKKKYASITKNRSKIEVIRNKATKLSSTVLLMIFGIAVIEFLCFYGLQNVTTSFEGSSDLQIEIRTFKLLSDSLLCYLVLNYRIHRHHYLSIFILILGITLVTIQNIVITDYSDWFLIFIFFGHSYLISLRDIWEKWIIENKFVSAVRILFFRGVYGTIISFALGVIYIFAFPPPSIHLPIFTSFQLIFTSNGWTIFWLVVYFVCCIFYNFFYSLTKQYFNPAHTVISDSFSSIMWMIILEIMQKNPDQENRYWALLVVGYFLFVFGCLVYNDIIILYFWGLEANTKYEVMQRSLNEMEETQMTNYENDNEEDSVLF